MKLLASAILAFHVAAGPALAGPAVDAASKAEQLAAQSKFDEAFQAIDEAREAIWKAAPLTFREALFDTSDPQGFGIFDARESTTFKKSEPLIIYSEPMGFGYGQDGELYVIDLALDFIIKKPDGSEVAKQENFASLTLRSRVPNKEFMAKVTYDVSGLPAGDYSVTTIAHDKNPPKTGEFTLDFTLTD